MTPKESSLCSTAEEVTRGTTWIIKNFDSLMQEPGYKCLDHPTLKIQINPSAETSTKWNIYCSPNTVNMSRIRNMRLNVIM